MISEHDSHQRFENPPPEPLASATGFLLSWNGRRAASEFVRALRPLGLRPPQFGLLILIEADPGTTQQELVTRSPIDPSSMVAVIDELEKLGLAERRKHPEDRPKHALHLTAAGKRTLGQARKSAAAMTEELLSPLSEHERETLRLLLRKLAGLEDR